MTVRLSLPAVVTLTAAIIVIVLFRYFWSYRREPGGWWWLAVLTSMALYGATYGTGLLVFDPTIRWVFEASRYTAAAMSGPAFLGFALTYTGRQQYLHSWPFRGLVALLACWVLLMYTTPFHSLVWQNFHIVPTLGAATVAFTRQPLFHAGALLAWLAIGAGTVLLFDTIISYGPLYRTQALAIALTPLPVAVASYAHIATVGPVPHLDLTPVAFLPHLALDTYALFYGGMFEMTPAARRIGERAALDDLGTPVAIVDDEDRVVKLNDTATRTFGVDRRAALGESLAAVLSTSVDLEGGTLSATIETPDGRREFDIVSSPVDDTAGRRLGYTVVFHDVTEQRRRQQRLEVLNRVLRHNLRNDVTALQGYLDPIATGEATRDASDTDPQRLASQAEENLSKLVGLGAKAREIDRLVERDTRTDRQIDLTATLRKLAESVRAEYPGVDFRTDFEADLRSDVDEQVVEAVIHNLVENAVEHHDGEQPQVEIVGESDAMESGAWVEVSVADNGPGIPAHEREVIVEGDESELKHGSGLGLWMVKWAVSELGGAIEFSDNEPRGSIVTVRFPAFATPRRTAAI